MTTVFYQIITKIMLIDIIGMKPSNKMAKLEKILHNYVKTGGYMLAGLLGLSKNF